MFFLMSGETCVHYSTVQRETYFKSMTDATCMAEYAHHSQILAIIIDIHYMRPLVSYVFDC